MDAKSEFILSRVSSLRVDQGIFFSRHFDVIMDTSYSWDLLVAAYIAHCAWWMVDAVTILLPILERHSYLVRGSLLKPH